LTKIYCDGSRKYICYIIEGQDPQIVPALGNGITVTSNEGEYYALIRALDTAKAQHIEDVIILSDSQLIVNQLTKNDKGIPIFKAKEKRMRDLRNIVWSMARGFTSVGYEWIPREENPAGIALEEIK